MGTRSLSESVSFRAYQPGDFEALLAMLQEANTVKSFFSAKDIDTEVMTFYGKPVGFYSYCVRNGWFYLVHFCVGKSSRDNRLWRQMLNQMKNKISSGVGLLLLHHENKRLIRFVGRVVNNLYFIKKSDKINNLYLARI